MQGFFYLMKKPPFYLQFKVGYIHGSRTLFRGGVKGLLTERRWRSTSSRDPGPSLWLSPIRSRTRPTETQPSESSFSTVQESSLCRFCGEGRKDTKALWIVCSHVSQRGRVKQTCEYRVHALCLGTAATTKAPLSRIEWKCPHHIMITKDKNKNSQSVIVLFF